MSYSSARSSIGLIDYEKLEETSKQIKLDTGETLNGILDNSAAKHKLSIRPKKKYGESRHRNVLLEVDAISRQTEIAEMENSSKDLSHQHQHHHNKNVDKIGRDAKGDERSDAGERMDGHCKREAVVKELLETEEEFCRDLVNFVEQYMKPSDDGGAPTVVRDNTDVIFSNFKLITNFHNTILLEGIKYYSNEPRMLGKTFLRLERDFDKHIAYCRDLPLAQQFLADNPRATEFFEDISQKLGDGKNILEYLQLPVQRINDYQVLLKDLVKYSERLGENVNDLRKALELMLAIPQRANDNKFLNNIEGFHGNIHNLGRLLRHDWFTVDSAEWTSKERYLFLFKDHILICKVRKISDNRSVFTLKELVSLSTVKVRDFPDDRTFAIVKDDSQDFVFKIHARKDNVKNCWIEEIRKHSNCGKVAEKEEEISKSNDNETLINVAIVPEEKHKSTEQNGTSDVSKTRTDTRSFQREGNQVSLVESLDEDIEQSEAMNRRLSVRKSYKSYEESYSTSGQHETRTVHSSTSSSSRFSSTSVYEEGNFSSQGYRSSITSGSAKTSYNLALDNGDKPVFNRTIAGLHLEPGDTAVFECQLESKAELTWLKDNKALDDRLADRVSRSSTDDGTYRLELQHVTELDSGTYTALAQNGSNYATCTAQLVVEKISDEESQRRKEANAPFFTVRLKDTELMENTNFTYVVKVKGTPNPEVKFFKDGVPLKSGDDRININCENAEVGFYELIISKVEAHHGGVYSCKASNSFGEAYCEGTLTITDDKVVFRGLENEGSARTEDKSFSWFKDGKSFEPDERFKVLLGNEDDSIALVFQHVKPDDAGLYTCVASTTAGKISCSAELSVQGVMNPLSREPEKPKICNDSKSVEADIGKSAMLEAKVVGFPKPQVKWFHEDVEIKAEGRYKFLYDDQDTVTLVIKNINPNDGGSYSIVAKNELGEECTEIKLIVKGAPKIIKKLEDVEVNVNSCIKITTQVEGSPTPDVKWYKDGKEITSSDRIKLTRDSSTGTCCITIEKATADDQGSYSIVASNEINKVSDSCSVKVNSPPTMVKSLDKSVEVAEGQDLVFQIQLSKDSIDSDVKWTKDGVTIKSDGKKVIITQEGDVHTLTIRGADASDSSRYSVQVSNKHGVTEDEAEAKVTHKTCAPAFKKGLEDTIAREGDANVEFSVEISAYPKPKIRWYLDEMEITEKRNEYTKLEEDTRCKLILKKVTTELKGTYKCRVENDSGSAETCAKLTVQSKPVFVKLLDPKITVDEGAELTLSIECSGCPEPEISWFKDGEELSTDAHIKITKDSHRSESYSMSLTLIRSSDSGDYEARATNCMGTAVTKTFVQVFSNIVETSDEGAEGLKKREKENVKGSETGNLTNESEQMKEEKEVWQEDNADYDDDDDAAAAAAVVADRKCATVKAEVTKEEEREIEPDETSGGEQENFSLLKPPVNNFHDNSWGGVQVEEVDVLEEKSNNLFETEGVVEEYLDSENISDISHHKLHVNRGVSIVSLSEDERTLSRNNSATDLNEKGFNNEEEKGFNSLSPQAHRTEQSDLWTSPARVEANRENLEPGGPSGPDNAGLEPHKKKDEMFEAPPNNSNLTHVPNNNPLQTDENQVLLQSRPELGSALDDQSPMEKLKDIEPEESKIEDNSNDEEDAVVNDLLKRISKQRSVLEEILTKEADTQKEGKDQKPSFKEKLKEEKCAKGQDVTFQCVILSNTEPDVTWMHEGKTVEIDGKRVIKTVEKSELDKQEFKCTLKILKTTAADAGLYLVKAQNKAGYDESSASLTIRVEEEAEKPKINKLKDAVAALGEDAVFEAEIVSASAVSVKWFNEAGQQITDGDRIILNEDKTKGVYKMTVKKTTLEDVGEYQIVVSNDAGETRQKVKLSTQGEKPSFVKPLGDLEVLDGQDVDLLTRCNGVPKPDVKWYKGGKELCMDDRVVVKTQVEGQVSTCLSIGNFGQDDVGEYKVTATNAMGTAENKFKLNMCQTAPKFEKEVPRSVDVNDDLLDLKCKVSGSPKPTLKWLKDGEPVVPGQRVKISEQPGGVAKLVIEDVTPEDGGTYAVVAENCNGKATGKCVVSVQPKLCKPKFVEDLQDVQGVPGEPLSIKGKVTGNPVPEIKWFKDGRPLKPGSHICKFNDKDGRLELLFDVLEAGDAGDYSAKAINKLGEAVGMAKVEVVEEPKLPKFDSLLFPTTAVEGTPVKFSVKATGNPKPEIKWSHNGKPIEADGENVIIKCEPDGSSCLLLSKCSPEDVGDYVATAVNSQGEVPTKASLNVLEKTLTESNKKEPEFVNNLNNANVDEDEHVILSASVSGNPMPEVSWEKDGSPLYTNDRITPIFDGKKVSLEIRCCRPSDSGVYTCHLKNRLGTAKSSGKVKVKKTSREPVFEEEFRNTTEVADKDARFNAVISGNPKPEVEWFFNGQSIKNSKKYEVKCDGNKHSLTVRNCQNSDRGLYRCCAANKAGKADCVAQLDVLPKIETEQKLEPPNFLKKISDCDVYKKMNAKFTACCTGFPKPDVEWFKNNEKLKLSDRVKADCEDNGLIRLTIFGVTEDDVGSYRVRIRNPHGEAECSAQLTCDTLQKAPKKEASDRKAHSNVLSVLPKPLTDRPIISRMSDRHMTLSWKPYIPSGSHPPVTYVLEMCKQPDGDWFTVRKGIRSCACDIRNLEPFQDYRFRVRVENKYGISDPSPYAETYRQKILADLNKSKPEFNAMPKGYDVYKQPHDGYEHAPEFLHQEHDVQYGIKNQNSNLFWFVYGYPKPSISYYFNGEPVEMGGRYDCSYTGNGQATLFINRMLDRDVGTYEAVARNEHGEARQKVRLEIGEHPVFIQRPELLHIMVRGSGTLTARIHGVPSPVVKWYKDWQPLAQTSRLVIGQPAPDTYTLTISEAIFKDSGLYSVTASNFAGTVTSSVLVHVEEDEDAYNYNAYERGVNVKKRSEPFSNYYDIGDELGRGTQGVTYHAVDRRTGDNYAAKFMHGRSELKPFMLNELNVMNELNHRRLIRLHNCFETNDLVVLIMELAGGGELLEKLIRETYVTEIEIANYIRQILWGLEYMHSSGYAHLSLTLNDLLISRLDGDDLKLCDFGLSRRITKGNLCALNYGMPEFVAPEVVNGEGVSYSADMWSLGVITYILLSGLSPFKGENDMETLTQIKEGKWKFHEEYFSRISSEAKDFISKLLMYKAEDRLDAKKALLHPWLNRTAGFDDEPVRIDTGNLRIYHLASKAWYKNANCKTWYRREPLSNAFVNPSKMIYPRGRAYTPEPEAGAGKGPKESSCRLPGQPSLPAREPLDYEVGNFKSESQYQCGPDTYLLQLRDVDLPCRLRHYMKVASERPGFSPDMDWRSPVIRERRKFMDVMDEEIDDERRARISQYGSEDAGTLRRLKHEVGCRSDGRAEAEALLEIKREGRLPFFREKPETLAIVQNVAAEFKCTVAGEPDPSLQWFKNDQVLAETSRIKMVKDSGRRYYLKFEPALKSDVGIYKVVARNKVGQAVARMRVVLASVPLSPDPPEVVDISDSQVLLKWKPDNDDVFTPVLCYGLQYKESDSNDWIDVARNIDQEMWLVEKLKCETTYDFRLLSKNSVGWSAPGLPTSQIKTKNSGSPMIDVSETQKQSRVQSGGPEGSDLPTEEANSELDYGVEETPLMWSDDDSWRQKYKFNSEILRGPISSVLEGTNLTTGEQVVGKVVYMGSDTEESGAHEFEGIRSLRHKSIVTLLSAARPAANVALLVMEKLPGPDVLTYFASRKEYNEDMVVGVLAQVLDALQYLHWRGFCHLNLQPDNIVMSSPRVRQFKLIDYKFAQKVSKLGALVNAPLTDYSAPEVVVKETTFPQTDIWSLGVIAYVLLSGTSPFRGTTKEETQENITYVRYRFEPLHKGLTQEAVTFLMQIFKRTPSKRPSVEECYESRWFMSGEFSIKRRQKTTLPGSMLKEYDKLYHEEKSGDASGPLTTIVEDILAKGRGNVQG